MSAIALRSSVREELARHGVAPEAEDTPAVLRERQVACESPRREYVRRVEELKNRFPLLVLPLHLWDQ